MNENIDLTKILKDCPKGWKFWSPIFGEVEFERNYGNKKTIHISVIKDGTEWYFTSDAKIILGSGKSQEIMIYPSRYLLDWSKFSAPWYKKNRFDSNTLNPFDKILVQRYDDVWIANFLSHYYTVINPDNTDICYLEFITITNGEYRHCIPYNDETKRLVGTTDEAPEYYRYWED